MLIETLFPNLTPAGYRVTSPPSLDYNCIAWAAGDSQQWWEPLTGPGYYWPDGVLLAYTIEALINAYEGLGYALCEGSVLEPGFEKVALYGDSKSYTHAARQTADGKWTSKLGHLEDIVHDSLHGLEGAEYGAVLRILKKAVGPASGARD